MGGLPCRKEIIDQRNALVQQLDCMVASIHLACETGGSGVEPTYKQRDEFIAASETLAKISASIQAYVGEGQ